MIRFTLFGLTMILMVLSAAGKSPAPGPFKIGVLDFTSADVEGNKRFLDDQKQVLTIPAASTLNSEDRQSIHPVMQGFVRMIDAWDSSKGKVTRIYICTQREFQEIFSGTPLIFLLITDMYIHLL